MPPAQPAPFSTKLTAAGLAAGARRQGGARLRLASPAPLVAAASEGIPADAAALQQAAGAFRLVMLRDGSFVLVPAADEGRRVAGALSLLAH